MALEAQCAGDIAATLTCSGTSSDPMLEMIHAGWMSQALCAMAELGLADHLPLAPAGSADLTGAARSVAELAAATGCEASALARLLAALTSLGLVLAETPAPQQVSTPGQPSYRLSALGRRLRSDAPDGLAAQARWFGRHSWSIWGGLTQSVRSGVSERRRRGSAPGYAHLADDAQAAETFNQAMHQLTRLLAPQVAAALDLRGVVEILDVGGGQGELLVACLQASPGACGRLLELAHALPGAQAHLVAAGLAGRAVVEQGDFFAPIRSGADLVLLKAVLHNWDDAHCAAILARLYAALLPGGRLVVVERVVPARVCDCAAHRGVMRSDLNMLVSLGGRERSQPEFAQLLAQAGFGAADFRPVGEGFEVIEARRPA